MQCPGLGLRSAAPQMTGDDIATLEAAQLQCNDTDSLGAWDVANRAFDRALVAPPLSP